MAFKQLVFKLAVLLISLIFVGPFQALADEPPTEESTSPLAQLVENEIASSRGIDFWSSLSNGMIVRELTADGKLIGAKDSKTIFSMGDIVYILLQKESPASSNEWVLFRKIKKVYHPKTKEFVGDLIEITGTVRAIENHDHTITGQIIRSKDAISLDDEIAAVGTLMRTATSPEGASSDKKDGTIIEVRDNRLDTGEQDIVYIDRGRKDGILPGNRFEILHGGQETGHRFEGKKATLPQRSVGHLVILSTQEQTATARILESSEPISKGDPLQYLPKNK